jgi:replicative DNA helicase
MKFDLNAEASVLSGIINNPDKIADVYHALGNADFFHSKLHKGVYQAIIELYMDSKDIDQITILDKMRENGNKDKGLHISLNNIDDVNFSGGNIDSHINIILKCHKTRMIEEMGKRITSAVNQGKNTDELNEIVAEYDEVRNMSSREKSLDMREVIMKDIEHLSEIGDGQREVGTNTGFEDVDGLIKLQGGEVYFLGSRPGMGKTSLAVKMAYNVAMQGKRVIYFTLETTKTQINHKLVCISQNVSDNEFKHESTVGQADRQDKLYNALDNAGAEYLVDDNSYTIDAILSETKRLHKDKKVDLVVIDHANLIGSDDTKYNRNNELTMVSRKIKMLSKEIQAPMLVLVQLNRGVEMRPEKIPMLSDLRETGSFEQDATAVFFLYRPEYYGIQIEDNENTHGMVKFIIAKNRYGRTGHLLLRFDNYSTNFSNW